MSLSLLGRSIFPRWSPRVPSGGFACFRNVAPLLFLRWHPGIEVMILRSSQRGSLELLGFKEHRLDMSDLTALPAAAGEITLDVVIPASKGLDGATWVLR